MIDYTGFLFGKGQPRVLVQEASARDKAKNERRVYDLVRKRDGLFCQVPTCEARSTENHHIVYRSHGGKTTTENLIRLCLKHHRYRHQGLLSISGNADDHPQFEGRL